MTTRKTTRKPRKAKAAPKRAAGAAAERDAARAFELGEQMTALRQERDEAQARLLEAERQAKRGLVFGHMESERNRAVAELGRVANVLDEWGPQHQREDGSYVSHSAAVLEALGGLREQRDEAREQAREMERRLMGERLDFASRRAGLTRWGHEEIGPAVGQRSREFYGLLEGVCVTEADRVAGAAELVDKAATDAVTAEAIRLGEAAQAPSGEGMVEAIRKRARGLRYYAPDGASLAGKDVHALLGALATAKRDCDDMAKMRARVAELEGALVDARKRWDNASAALLMVGSELAGDPKIDPEGKADPRWTPTLDAAGRCRRERDAARALAALLEDAIRRVIGNMAGMEHTKFWTNMLARVEMMGSQAYADYSGNVKANFAILRSALPTATVHEQAPKFHGQWVTCPACSEGFDAADQFVLERALITDDSAPRCHDCQHSGRCKSLLGPSYRDEGPCDWSPSRFQAASADDVGKAPVVADRPRVEPGICPKCSDFNIYGSEKQCADCTARENARSTAPAGAGNSPAQRERVESHCKTTDTSHNKGNP